MKKLLLYAALSVLLLMTSSCDFLRRAAGRPSSADIEAKKEYISQIEAQRKAEAEQKAMAMKYTQDSLAAWEFIAESGIMLTPSSQFERLDTSLLESGYYLIIGTFFNEYNAMKTVAKVVDAGYSASTINLKPGYTTVGVCQSDDIVEFANSLKKVREEVFCPKEAWILVR